MNAPLVLGAVDFNVDKLSNYLDETFGSDQGLLEIERISGGQSNPTYFVNYGGEQHVLRKQPAGPILKGAHAIDREYRVLEALYQTTVPVPKPVLYEANAELLGTPFYLMEKVEGRVFTDTALKDLPKTERRNIWMAVADVMAQMHNIQPGQVGLEDFGKPGNYFERQLARWDRQYRSSSFVGNPIIDELHDWLVTNQPADDGQVSLCHGDFRLGNLLFHPEKAEVIAILDWELATLGHPLADLGFCCMAWHTQPFEYGGLLGENLEAGGLPDEDEFVQRYQASAEHKASLQPFHKAFALYRFSIIFVGISERAREGNAADPDAERYAPLAERFAARALEIALGRSHPIV
jgi:aminoglycoside phosphotransferase (APT) family kinase protein